MGEERGGDEGESGKWGRMRMDKGDERRYNKGVLHVYTSIYGKLASSPYMEVHTWTYFILSSTVSLCTSRAHLFKQHPSSRRKIHTTVESFVQPKLASYPGTKEGEEKFRGNKPHAQVLFLLPPPLRLGVRLEYTHVHTCSRRNSP